MLMECLSNVNHFEVAPSTDQCGLQLSVHVKLGTGNCALYDHRYISLNLSFQQLDLSEAEGSTLIVPLAEASVHDQ